MRAPRRLLPLVLLLPLLALTGFTPSASGDPVPPLYNPWPRCGVSPDDDGQYCIVSVTKNGVDVPPVDYDVPGTYDDPWVDLLDNGTVRFGLQRTTVYPSSGPTSESDVSPGDTWVYTVNVGGIQPNELYGNIRNVDLSFGGAGATGHTFTLTFKPTPAAWRLLDSSFTCSYDGGCGDDTTVADTVYNGFVTGYVTDDATSGLNPAEIADRHGYVNAYNAQDAYWFYDPDSNSLVVRLANPHLQSPGVPATGYYQTRIPNALLVNEMGVPDPSTLTGGSLTVVRAGGSTSVPFTLTHYAGGIDVRINGITFSRPQYKIHPKASAPGAPRWGTVHRTSRHTVRVAFHRPRADGGKPVTSYGARCRRATGSWHTTRGRTSPLAVGSVPRRGVSCQVRARNTIGWGRWSHVRREG